MLRQNGICREMINILEDFLSYRKQRVIFNAQCSSWADIHAGVPQGSMLFLIYINDLSNDIKSKCKLIADDSSLFSVVHDIDTSRNDLNHDLEKSSEWAFQWKMNFNPGPTKQVQKVIFSRKKTVSIHPLFYFNKNPVNSTATNKHLGMILDSKLIYVNHLQSVFSRVNKTIGLLRKFQPALPRKSLVTICKSFIRPHLDYVDVILDWAYNESFHQNLESLQYSAAITITRAISGTSSEKLFQELGLETLKSRRWLRTLCLFYKLIKEQSPAYLFQLIPENMTPYTTRSVQKSQTLFLKTKAKFFKNPFFLALYWSGKSLMLIFVTQLLVMFLRELY